MQKKNTRAYLGDAKLDTEIGKLLADAGITYDEELYRQLVVNVIKLGRARPHLADLKLIARALGELRVADRVFKPYRHIRKISIFGSARTAPSHPAFKAAEKFGRMMAESGYMVITGGGDGIMGAAQKGAGRERSFGLNIRLPFEQAANDTIQGDEKLVNFNYFFTRKLNFVKESHALACFPGGFGTMDEAFETLTLVQTGKSKIVPLVFIDVAGGSFWKTFENYLRDHLLKDKLISASDFSLFKVTDSLEEAHEEVLRFYSNFHSYRFVGDQLVIRMQRHLPEKAVEKLEKEFADICQESTPAAKSTALKEESEHEEDDPAELPRSSGLLKSCLALPQEINEPEIAHLPRLCVPFDRKQFGRLRELINFINNY